MPIETTVLLVEAAALPSSLEDQLKKREVFVEHGGLSELEQVLPVLVPDLVLCSGKSNIEELLSSFGKLDDPPALIVIADRATIRKLKDAKDPKIAGLLPQDLPVAALAHRVATMARRSAQGEPLDGPTTSKGIARPSPVPAKKPLAAQDRSTSQTKSSDAKKPLGQKKSGLGVAKGTGLKKSEPKKSEPKKAALKTTEPKKRELKKAESPKPLHRKSETPTQVTPAVPLAINQEVKILDADEERTKAEVSARLRAVKEKTKAAQEAQSKKAAQQESDKSTHESSPPSTENNPARPVTQDDELSVIAELPVDMRVPLSTSRANLPTIRLALLDTDLTRADAVSAALRREGMEILPVTPNVESTRWPLLRRFAPQGLVVDEKSMVRGAAEWVETFRGDLFLRHVPVVLMRFSRLFKEGEADVELSPLLPLIEPLGKEEFALLDKLKPGRQVDLRLSQLAPYRLVQMLTEQDRNTRLDCVGDKERIAWPLGPGYAGKAKLTNRDSEKVIAKLSPEDAMSWLLSHDDCEVSVHETQEPLAHASESKDAQVLLREMTESVAKPTRHESVRPSPFVDGPISSEISSSDLNPATEKSSQDDVKLPPMFPSGAPPEMSPDEPGPAMTQASPETPIGIEIPKSGVGAAEIWDKVQESSKKGWSAYQGLFTPLSQKLPAQAVQAVSILVPILVLGVGSALAFGGGDSDDVATTASEAPAGESDGSSAADASADTPAAEASKGSPSANPKKAPDPEPQEEENEDSPPADALWKIAPDAGLASCEDRLGPAAPKAEDEALAVGYWKKARRFLMVGKNDQALEMMCLAGLYNPMGPAAEGLAEYYLAQRSLKEAERWVRTSLKADGQRRSSHELLGDIENQKGNNEEARKLWLETMLLTGDETKKLGAISRKLMQDAKLAQKGGDLPRAERELRRAASLSPDNVMAATQLAELFLVREMLDAAANWAARARKLDANFSPAKMLSGRIAEAQQKVSDARAYYESVPPGDPYYKQARKRLMRIQ